MADAPSSTGFGLKKGDNLLDREFRKSYFKQLVGQMLTIGNEVNDTDTRKRVAELVALRPEEVEWDDIYQLELALIKLEPEDRLRRRAWALRSEYANVAPKEYLKYQSSDAPDAVKSTIAALRADLIRVQEELNWYYTVLWVQETFRTNLVKRVTGITVRWIFSYCIVALLFISGVAFTLHLRSSIFEKNGINSLLATNKITDARQRADDQARDNSPSWAQTTNAVLNTLLSTNEASKSETAGGAVTDWRSKLWTDIKGYLRVVLTYWLAAFSGTLGALISVLRRIQNMSLDGNTDKNLIDLEQGSASIDYSPLLGAVFALLLLFLFMGNLLSGSLFPTPPAGADQFSYLGCVPSGCENLAKLIIWCFIAGFAEKLVPDTLDKLQSQSASRQNSSSLEKTP